MGNFTDAWREELKPYLLERGAKAELARWLEQNLGGTFETRQVQLARFLAGAGADGEFVLAVESWLAIRPLSPIGPIPRRTPRKPRLRSTDG